MASQSICSVGNNTKPLPKVAGDDKGKVVINDQSLETVESAAKRLAEDNETLHELLDTHKRSHDNDDYKGKVIDDQFPETLLNAEKSSTEDMEVTPRILDPQKRRIESIDAELAQLIKRKKATEKTLALQKSQPPQQVLFLPISQHLKPQNPKSPIPKSIEASLMAQEVEGENTEKPNWLELPREVTANILRRLDSVEILKNARNVCSMWWNVCKDPIMWRTIDMSHCNEYCNPYYSPYYGWYGEDALRFHEKLCRYAVDLSCGHVEDIIILRLCTDELLNYIADRASHLRRIKLFNCKLIFDKGIIEAVKKLPLLEELDMSLCRIPSKITLEVLGRSCPLLRSLRLQTHYRSYFQCDDPTFAIAKTMPFYPRCDDPAFAVAETMPGLRRLEICDYPITNVGLLAILDGCPLLEYLNLQGCPYLDFSEDKSLWERCVGQIKDVCYY